MTGTALIISLPYPPSVNHYWRHVGSKVLISREGRAYRDKVLMSINYAGPVLTGRLSVDLLVYPPDARKRDIENVCKALLDALQHVGVYEDDSQIDRLLVERKRIDKGMGYVLARIEEIP